MYDFFKRKTTMTSFILNAGAEARAYLGKGKGIQHL